MIIIISEETLLLLIEHFTGIYSETLFKMFWGGGELNLLTRKMSCKGKPENTLFCNSELHWTVHFTQILSRMNGVKGIIFPMKPHFRSISVH